MISGQSIKALVESDGLEGTALKLGELMDDGSILPEDFSLREIAEACCGYDWVRRLDPRRAGGRRGLLEAAGVALREAGEAVDVAAFRNITGQIIYSKIHQGWDGVKDRLGDVFEEIDTPFDGEKIPGIGKIRGDGDAIHPGMPYPELGFGQQYWETPSTTKRGLIVSITKEAVFFDRTGLMLRRAGEVGERLRMNKLKRQAACLAGVNVQVGNDTFVANNHKWGGTTYNTYSTTANAIGINALAGNPLVNYTSVEQAMLLFAALRDPDTGDPINVEADTMVVMPAKEMTGKRINTSTEVRSTWPGYSGTATEPGNVQMLGGSPLPNLDLISSKMLYKIVVDSGVSAVTAKDWWFLLEKKKAFFYMRNWDITVVQSPPNSEKDFEQDIVDRWKASERGVPYSADPRFTTKNYAT